MSSIFILPLLKIRIFSFSKVLRILATLALGIWEDATKIELLNIGRLNKKFIFKSLRLYLELSI